MNLNDCKHCFAVPGENNIVDVINPATGLSLHAGETLEQVRLRYPGAEKMTLDDYCAAKAKQQDTPVQWQEIDDEAYDDALQCLPPALMAHGGFMIGEPHDHHAQTGQARYGSYVARHGKYYEASRALTKAEFRAIAPTLSF